MTGFLLLVILVVMVTGWVVLHNRFYSMEQRIAVLSGSAARQSQVKELTDRLTRLERSVAELRVPEAPAVERVEPVVVAPQPVVHPAAQPMAQSAPPVFTEPPVAPPAEI